MRHTAWRSQIQDGKCHWRIQHYFLLLNFSRYTHASVITLYDNIIPFFSCREEKREARREYSDAKLCSNDVKHEKMSKAFILKKIKGETREIFLLINSLEFTRKLLHRPTRERIYQYKQICLFLSLTVNKKLCIENTTKLCNLQLKSSVIGRCILHLVIKDVYIANAINKSGSERAPLEFAMP